MQDIVVKFLASICFNVCGSSSEAGSPDGDAQTTCADGDGFHLDDFSQTRSDFPTVKHDIFAYFWEKSMMHIDEAYISQKGTCTILYRLMIDGSVEILPTTTEATDTRMSFRCLSNGHR